ncbi:MAG: hydantoinase/oxoprolinase family protein, partial [Rhodospirillales bacterium]|nr:hydantoinase/oxoprolinase family protein [Rhodospirillales bacterium]
GREPETYQALIDLCEMLALPVIEPRGAIFANFPQDHALHQGQEIEPFDEADFKNIMAGLIGAEGEAVESLAICFLHAYANPSLEIEAERLAAGIAPDLPCSRSSALWPEIREYERAMIAVLNAYVTPIMGRYLGALSAEASDLGLGEDLFVTISNGGVMSAEAARKAPVKTLLSGPAAGVVGAAYVARQAGLPDAITLDMGGTSADVSIIRGGEPVHSSEARIGDFPLIMPAVDVFSVGAGGGSIAWFDEFGLLKIGPKSAGADPGPACYGLGGTEPAVTDAYLTCGYLNPDNFLGGAMKLDKGCAQTAIDPIAQRLGSTAEGAAESMLKIATSNMSTALLPLMAKRGIEPRDYSLIAFGGAGTTHACFLAEDLRIPRIIVPPTPGTLCALGAAIADLKFDHIETVRRPLAQMNDGEIEDIYSRLEEEGCAWLAQQGTEVTRTDMERAADIRYVGQAFDVETPISENEPASTSLLAQSFHEIYENLYRNSDANAPVELINLRVRVIGRLPEPAPGKIETKDGPEAAEVTRQIYLDGAWCQARVLARDALRPGQTINGPAVIEQFDTTTLITGAFTCRVHETGYLMLEGDV